MIYPRSIFSGSRALVISVSILICACEVYTPYTFALNPEYHVYVRRVMGTKIFINAPVGTLESITKSVPANELSKTVGPRYYDINPPPAYTGWKEKPPDKYGARPIGVAEYLKAECRLAGFDVLEEKPSDERVFTGWCGFKRNKVSELKGGRHLIRFYLHKRVTRMDVEWVCGLRRGDHALWERSYFGTGQAELDETLGGFDVMDMEHRAYSEAMGMIVKAYVDDLVSYFNKTNGDGS